MIIQGQKGKAMKDQNKEFLEMGRRRHSWHREQSRQIYVSSSLPQGSVLTGEWNTQADSVTQDTSFSPWLAQGLCNRPVKNGPVTEAARGGKEALFSTKAITECLFCQEQRNLR